MGRYRDTKSKIFLPPKENGSNQPKIRKISILFENIVSANRPKKDMSTVTDKN